MGNTLCKPVIQTTDLISDTTNKTEPLLTEEAIKELIVTEPVTKEEKEPVPIEPPVTIEEQPIKEEVGMEPPIEEEVTKIEEPITKEEEEIVKMEQEDVVEMPIIKEQITQEDINLGIDKEAQLSIVQPPDEASSTSSKDDEVPPLKKKRGRKKKTD
jgi:hypothetical protein